MPGSTYTKTPIYDTNLREVLEASVKHNFTLNLYARAVILNSKHGNRHALILDDRQPRGVLNTGRVTIYFHGEKEDPFMEADISELVPVVRGYEPELSERYKIVYFMGL